MRLRLMKLASSWRNSTYQIEAGSHKIAGIMAESFLVEGNQPMHDLNNLTYGLSITDPCLGWKDTATMLDMLAQSIKVRRSRH